MTDTVVVVSAGTDWSAWLIAAATVVLVAVTALYAKRTRELVKKTGELVELTREDLAVAREQVATSHAQADASERQAAAILESNHLARQANEATQQELDGERQRRIEEDARALAVWFHGFRTVSGVHRAEGEMMYHGRNAIRRFEAFLVYEDIGDVVPGSERPYMEAVIRPGVNTTFELPPTTQNAERDVHGHDLVIRFTDGNGRRWRKRGSSLTELDFADSASFGDTQDPYP